VNNNAAAVVLALNTLAQGKEVVVSRGELIEIGGSFRIPDVLAKSGAHLREVGTTNRTHPEDYETAIGPLTGALLKVHTSNYRVVGFTAEVALGALVAIGRGRGVPVIEDLGSGALIDLSALGLPREPVVTESIAAGVDLVTFSGDKLLGGPQAGLVVGRRDLVEQLRRNPLKRALRCDKLTLAALSATLRLYRRSPDLARELPTLRWLTRSIEEIERLGAEALRVLAEVLGPEYRCDVVPERTQIGSGALPTETVETRAVAVSHPSLGADAIAARFRRADPPVIGRVHDGRFLLDLRTVASAADLAVELPPVVPMSAPA
jgi:L-seryl-tRNA(Ser) seleniumtransferase